MNNENPYRAALLWIAAVLIIGGGIAIIAGSNADSPSYLSSAPDTRPAVIVVGAGILSTGAGALLLWVVVSAIGWRPMVSSEAAQRVGFEEASDNLGGALDGGKQDYGPRPQWGE